VVADKGFFIEALPDVGVVTFLALVREKEIRIKRNGGFYLHLILADRTGELEARAWDQPEATAALFDCDDIVKVRGTIELYNERRQLIIQRIRRCEEEEFVEADFCACSERNPEEMFVELLGYVERVANEPLRALLLSILSDPTIAARLKAAPGAMRIHHCYRGGLLEHIVGLCGLAERVVQQYPRLNLDWLISAAVLHDVGKIEELGTSRLLGYTTRGQLLGHVALSLEIIDHHVTRLEGFPVEIKSMVQHIVVSHHGEIEKGALRQPLFAEALVFHYLDEIDARLEQAWRLIDRAPAGEEWTAYVPSLERSLYRRCPLRTEQHLDDRLFKSEAAQSVEDPPTARSQGSSRAKALMPAG
jgi:3'-5' exoribonuclease